VGEAESPFEPHAEGAIEPDAEVGEYGETFVPQHDERSGVAFFLELQLSTTVEVCIDNVVLRAVP
jgi:hypothetical protein